MVGELRILIVEDLPTDAELIERELRRSGFQFRSVRVDTRDAFLEQLEAFTPGLILSDYHLPQFDGRAALELARERAPHVPVIICTGPTNEEIAVECMKAGAADYVIKDRLVRLAPAVKGALAEKHLAEEKRKSEEGMHAAARQWRTTFDAIREGIMLVDSEGTILRCNEAMRDLVGKPFQELIGQSCWRVVHGTTEPPEQCMQARMRESGKRESTELKWNGHWLNVTVDPLFDDEGKIAGAVHIMSDITERKRVEEALRESEEKHRLLFERSRDAIMTLAPPSWRFTSGNPATVEMFGVQDEADFILRPPWEYSPPCQPDGRSSDEKAKEMIETAMREGSHFFEWRHQRLDGEEFPATVLLTRFELAGEDLLQATVRDVSSEKELEEQLRESQKLEAIGQLAGGVAHDFNNLLTGIKGYVQFALESAEAGTQTQEDLAQTLALADRAVDLTRQLLAFSRRQTLEMTVLNVNQLITDQLKMLGRLLGEDIDIRFSPAADLDNVRADPGQLEQVVMNLALNARDAMPDGGRLTIETANVELSQECADQHAGNAPGPYVLIAVSDTGCGMSEEIQSQVFDPFFTTKDVGQGTGLGLATVYGIVKQHDGNIWVYSEPGEGTTFKVYLAAVAEATTAQARIRQPAVGGSETILVVEDEPAVRDITRRVLEGLGYRVLAASDPGEAEDAAAGEPQIDLLLTDVVLPDRNGRALYESLSPTRPDLKVLYMSGYTDNVIAHHGVLDPGTPFIEKPFDPHVLGRKVREVLDRRDGAEGVDVSG